VNRFAFVRRMPIRSKLQAMILLVTGLACLGASLSFVTYQFVAGRSAVARSLAITSRIFGQQCSAALEFRQADEARSIMAALQADQQIMAAAVYDDEGNLFADYARPELEPGLVPPSPMADGAEFADGDLLVFQPIVSDGERIGTFHVRSDMGNLWRRLRVNVGVMAMILAITFMAAVLLSRRLGGLLTDPLLRLAAGVQAVSARNDYSIRVASGGGADETERLIAGFNAMLAEVQSRDDALARARDELEKRVAERTQELQERMGELVALNAELESFSYSVSHDLRAPLRAIGGYARMLVEDFGPDVPPASARYLDVIMRNTEKMGQLIDDLLAFSRMSRSPMPLAYVDMNRVVEDVIAETREQAPQRPLDVEVGPLPPAHGNAAMIRQVVTNLVANAVKYSRGRDRTVIRISATEGPDETVYRVSDNGVGFDMKHAGKLFGIFQRLHAPDEFEGTGVGLALVHRIVQRHGGRVWAESTPGVGSTFSFTLGDRRRNATAAAS
jgi:signal transduction histidine kinase